ncbi:MAG: peptidyl-prolyl cis-trans isomerase [Alphaproteobacteria bacterium]|jgi:peptidyl-prolyl cis-trans isomerase C|nr:peptidyl-prolyl cis-trans isomerase [Alphaproteobacteria bacterium]
MKSFISSKITSRVGVLSLALVSAVPMPLWAAAASTDTTSQAPAAPAAAEPADSTVVGKAVVDGKTLEVTYGEVKGKLKLLPPQLQSAPFKDIFPLLLKSVVTEKIISYYAEQSGIKNDPDYQKMVGECQKGVLQKLFLDKEIDKRATDDELKKAYEDVKKSAPKEDEYDISMITLTDKTKAENVLKELKKIGVSKFAEVANKESMNKIPDGNLGYVRLGELPEAFRDKVKNAAKATIVQNVVEISMPDPSDANKKVTTYNILMVKDKRAATFPPFEAVKGELKSAVGSKFAKEAIKEFEGKAKIELFGMDGKPLEAPKADAPKVDASKVETTKAAPAA